MSTEPDARAPRLTPLDADRLAEGRGLRGVPRPPGSVLTQDPRDDSHYMEVVAETVAPHWNSAVDLLRGGPEGYVALVQMRDRLAGHRARDQRAADRAFVINAIARRVKDIVDRESTRYGPEATLGDSVESGEYTDVPWEWVPEPTVFQSRRAIDDGEPPKTYRILDAEVDRLLAEFDALVDDPDQSVPLILVTFGRDDTWEHCRRLVSGETAYYRPWWAEDWRDRRIDLVEFRLAIVEQVLREHEVLGYVGEFGEAPRPVDLDDEQRSFLIAALGVLEMVDAGKLNPTWFAIQGEMSQLTRRSRNQLERIAEQRFGAFEKEVGSGRPSAQQVEKRYRLFRRQVERWAQQSGLTEDREAG